MENKPNVVIQHCLDIDCKTTTETMSLNVDRLYTVSELICLLENARERFGDR